MPRRTSLRGLPQDLQRVVDRLLIEDRHTIDELLAIVRQCGFPISRSAIGRYKKAFTDEFPPGAFGASKKAEFLGRLYGAGLPKPRIRVRAMSRPA